jgi:hypothetical protein
MVVDVSEQFYLPQIYVLRSLFWTTWFSQTIVIICQPTSFHMPEKLNFYQYLCDKPNFVVRCLLWQPTSIGLSVMNIELHVINTFQTHIAF